MEATCGKDEDEVSAYRAPGSTGRGYPVRVEAFDRWWAVRLSQPLAGEPATRRAAAAIGVPTAMIVSVARPATRSDSQSGEVQRHRRVSRLVDEYTSK